MSMSQEGKFITIYGINNIGKSTQSRILVENLTRAGYKAKHIKYPVYDLAPTGHFLDSVMRNPDGQKISEDELQLWFVMNRYQFEPELKKLLSEGYIIIAEDYSGTGIAWGTAKGLEQNWLEEANKYLLKEDFSILFEGKRNLIAREDNHVHEQNDLLIEKCTKVFLELADKYSWQKFQLQEKIEDSAKALLELVLNYLEKAQ